MWQDFYCFILHFLIGNTDFSSLIYKIIHFPDDSVKRKIYQSMIGVSWRAVILLTNIGLLANINWNTWQSPTWKLYNLCYETVSRYIRIALICRSGIFVKQKLSPPSFLYPTKIRILYTEYSLFPFSPEIDWI